MSALLKLACMVAVCAAMYYFSPLPNLKIEILEKPETCERKSAEGDSLFVHYSAYLSNGTQFHTSRSGDRPFVFPLGEGRVIDGFEQGLVDMCAGEKRRLVIPPHLGYGDEGTEHIPAGETLIYEVELLEIRDNPNIKRNYFREMDQNGDNMLSPDEIRAFIRQEAEKERKGKANLEFSEEKLETRVEEIFSNEDVDRDGFISHEEFTGPKGD